MLIWVITVIKLHDLLLTLLQVNTCSIVSKMNKHRLLILINTSYIINYQLSCLDHFHFIWYNSLSSEICVFYSGTSHNSIFQQLISCTKFYFTFFALANRFSAKSVGKHCFKSGKYHQNEVYLKCFQHFSNDAFQSSYDLFQVN